MFAKVIIDQDAKALDREFEYKIPEDMEVGIGERVMVPFGKRLLQGFIVEKNEKSEFDETKIKPIASKIENFSVIKPEMLALMQHMAEKLHLKLASILRLFIPSEMRTDKVRELIIKQVRLAKDFEKPSARAKKQIKIVEYLKQNDDCKFYDVSKEFV